MPSRKNQRGKRQVESYDHKDKKRVNNPPAGLVTPDSDPDVGGGGGAKAHYGYDPHLDPQLQWAGKVERTSFEIPTVSLHVHERIDPRTIIEAVRRKNGGANRQENLFDEEREIPLKQEIEFYQHAKDWSNRLIAGDSLLVMNSLLQKENMASKVQCVYIDPPYGIKYGSNFQPFINKRDVTDGKDEHLTREPEMIKAYRDTWELGLHSYLSYMRDRLLLARELLTESGSVFVQISDENIHHIREILDEVFGSKNFIALIPFRTKNKPMVAKHLEQMCDFLLWYAKDKQQLKYRQLFIKKDVQGNKLWKYIEPPDGPYHPLTKEEINDHSLIKGYSPDSIFQSISLEPVGINESRVYEVEFEGKTYRPKRSWKYDKETMNKLINKKRLIAEGNSLRGKYFLRDFPYQDLTTPWTDTNLGNIKTYVVQTAVKVIQRCVLMSTDPGDLVLDITCGSGTTAYVAEQWGRRWITCDTSRIAIFLAKQRLMTATFDYYKLAHPDEGVGSGFEYETIPHATFTAIANDEILATETLYDQPEKDSSRARVTGPFTIEAVPAPTVQPLNTIKTGNSTRMVNDATVARYGATLRHNEWCDELLKAGIRSKNGRRIAFSRVESLSCSYLSADAETKPETDTKGLKVQEKGAVAYNPQRAVISFGPEHAPLGRQSGQTCH